MNKVYLSLGSNLGEREKNLARAWSELEKRGMKILRRSSIYETEPVEIREQAWFLNCVIEVETDLPPQQLMNMLLEIELQLGRRRDVKYGPRTIDLDILLYADLVVNEPRAHDPSSENGGAAFRARAARGNCAAGAASRPASHGRGTSRRMLRS